MSGRTSFWAVGRATLPIANERTGETRLAGFLLLVLGAGFLTVIMLAASMAPGYDMNAGAISDLGITAQTALLFNGSVIAVGLLNLVAGYLLYRSHGKGWILAIFVLAGTGAIGVGLFPLDTGTPHSLFALLAFLSFNVEAIAGGTLVRQPMKAISAIAGLIGFAFVVLMVLGDGGNTAAFGPIGHGGTERMIVYPAMIWMLTFGGQLMAIERPAHLR